MPLDPYITIWEFTVPADRAEAFIEAYGPVGTWARLFRQASGYRGTELYRDRENPDRFVTIDFWLSIDDYRAFRSRFADQYAALDQTCASLTDAERPLGTFELADRTREAI
ncbi:MAG: antibiotic biosynthesis monooxygenase [Gemmatimonadota bacterium]|nr:antibiotic biosynthesis monooxygenase [Gemmatimonadota bacterium]MDH5283132.1 antibiotic biosynthesis monooxygenase [Gemmatimonadota bacterium]